MTRGGSTDTGKAYRGTEQIGAHRRSRRETEWPCQIQERHVVKGAGPARGEETRNAPQPSDGCVDVFILHSLKISCTSHSEPTGNVSFYWILLLLKLYPG